MSNWFADKQKRDPRPERDEDGDRKHSWDGKTPNSDRDKRFYRQREASYPGWINQDGYRVDARGRRIGGDV